MLNLKQLLILAVLTAPISLRAQQAAAPQPQQANPAPCTASSPKAPKGIHFHVPPALQSVIDKQRQQISQKIGVELPTTDEVIHDITQPKPCPAPAPLPPATAPAMAPIPAPAIAQPPVQVPAQTAPQQ